MVARRRRQGFVEQLLYVLVLIVVWVFLWDEVSGMVVISGALLAFALMRAFYLPPIQLSGRLNFYYGAYFLLWFMLNVLIASFQVAWLTVRPRPVDAGSVIAVDLATRSDLLITLVTMVNGLIPGSLVIEIDRARAVVFVHGLNCADEEELERVQGEDPPDRDPAHLRDRLAPRHRGAQRRTCGARSEAYAREARDPRARTACTSGEGSEGTRMNGQQGIPLVSVDDGMGLTIALAIGAVFLAAVVIAIVRIVRGPSILDRMIATDALLATIMCGLGRGGGLQREDGPLPRHAHHRDVRLRRCGGGLALRLPRRPADHVAIPQDGARTGVRHHRNGRRVRAVGPRTRDRARGGPAG